VQSAAAWLVPSKYSIDKQWLTYFLRAIGALLLLSAAAAATTTNEYRRIFIPKRSTVQFASKQAVQTPTLNLSNEHSSNLINFKHTLNNKVLFHISTETTVL